MQQSSGVKEAILRCYEVFSTGDLEDSVGLLTQEEGAVVIGTDPQEWANSRAEFVAFLEAQMTEGETVRLEAGEEPRCFEEGTVGWVADRPTFVLGDGSTVPSRMTAVMHQEDGEWKLVHAHWSVGVPNREAFGS
jgi:ketosteroid isomerase-like protein